MSAEWMKFPLNLMSDMPLVVRLCAANGEPIHQLKWHAEIPDGEGLVFVGSVGKLLTELAQCGHRVSAKGGKNLGVFYYRLGVMHAGIRSAGWAAGTPVTTGVAFAEGGIADLLHTRLLPRRLPLNGGAEQWVFGNPLRETTKSVKALATDTGSLFPFAFKRRECVALFSGDFRFDAKEYGGKASWQLNTVVQLKALRGICQTQLS